MLLIISSSSPMILGHFTALRISCVDLDSITSILSGPLVSKGQCIHRPWQTKEEEGFGQCHQYKNVHKCNWVAQIRNGQPGLPPLDQY